MKLQSRTERVARLSISKNMAACRRIIHVSPMRLLIDATTGEGWYQESISLYTISPQLSTSD